MYYNREAFEQWILKQTVPRTRMPFRNLSKRDDGSYHAEEIDLAWDAWKAAIDCARNS